MKLLLLLVLVLSGHATAAGIYKWTDAQGNLHFTDQPPPEANAEKVKLRINSYTSPEIAPISANSPTTDNNVVLYGADWCGYCKKAKRYFRAKNIAFREDDVEKSSKGRKDYKKMGGGGVPIILVGNKRLNGFSAAAFDRVYQRPQ